MKNRNWKYLLVAAICDTLFRFYPFYFSFGDPSENHNSRDAGQALGWLFLLIFVSPYINKNNKSEYIIYDCIKWCAIANLFDEIFGNPLEFGPGEKFFAVFIILRAIIKYRNYDRKHTPSERNSYDVV